MSQPLNILAFVNLLPYNSRDLATITRANHKSHLGTNQIGLNKKYLVLNAGVFVLN